MGKKLIIGLMILFGLCLWVVVGLLMSGVVRPKAL